MFELFRLNLDTKEFIDSIKGGKKALGTIGSGEDLEGLINSLGKATKLVGGLTVAYFAVKSAVDWIEEAEKIQQVNKNFELLGQSAGLATGILKEGLEKSSKGMIDTEDLLQSANKAIVTLGDNAQRLPEVLELAHKAGKVMGTDTLQAFEALNQAIASGNTRALKHMGIILDVDQVYKNHAKSIGIAVETMSQAEKQAALMNAVLDQGNKSLKGVSSEADTSSGLFKQLKTNVNDIYDAFVLAFEKGAGPIMRHFLSQLRDMTGWIKDKVTPEQDAWTRNAEGTNEAIKETYFEINRLKEKLNVVDINLWTKLFGDPEKEKKKIKDQITGLEGEINGLKERRKQLLEEESKSGDKKPDHDIQDPIKKKEQEEKWAKDVLEVRQKVLEDRIKHEETYDQVDANMKDQQKLREDQLHQKIMELKQQRDEGKINDAIYEQSILQVKEENAFKEQDLIRQTEDRHIKALENQAKYAKTTQAQISAGWKATSMKDIQQQKIATNMGSLGYNTLKKNAATAFRAIGDGSKTAAEAMRGFVLSSLADIAEAKGMVYLAEGIATYNPVEAVQGGILIALGSALRAAAGGGGGGIGGVGGGGGGAAPTPGETTPLNSQEEDQLKERERKTVTVMFNGPVINTEETRRWMVEQIRNNTDATDFKYDQLGI